MHGYELMAELSGLLGRRYRASPGSVYPALAALESEGLISSNEVGDRRVYELSAEGTAAVTARANRIAAMERRLGIKVASGLDAVLARFGRRVAPYAGVVGEEQIEQVLDRAAEEIERLNANRGKT